MKALFALVWILSIFGMVATANFAFLVPCLTGLVGFYICERTTEPGK